jgi:hypothetical protein
MSDRRGSSPGLWSRRPTGAAEPLPRPAQQPPPHAWPPPADRPRPRSLTALAGLAIGLALLVAAVVARGAASDPTFLSAVGDVRLYSAQDLERALARPVQAGWSPTLRSRLEQDCERSIIGAQNRCECYARVVDRSITGAEYQRFLWSGSARVDRAGVRAYHLCN